MSLANIQGKLSRTEMKKIMAGSGALSCSTKDCYSGGTFVICTGTSGSCTCPGNASGFCG